MKAILVLALLALFAAPAMADTPTQTLVTWSGVSGIETIATTFGDDAHSLVQFGGNNLVGNLLTIDSNNNPYSYGVDSIENRISATFGASEGYGAKLRVDVVKDQNYVPMYGPAGASTTSWVQTSNTGYLGLETWANYAELGNANYDSVTHPVDAPNNWQLQATGNTYSMYHDIETGYSTPTSLDGAFVALQGSGSGKITAMSDDTWNSGFKLANGAGCYSNAHVYATGNGQFDLTAADNNYLSTMDSHLVGGIVPGNGNPGSAVYDLQIIFNGATSTTPFQYDNWQIAGGMSVVP